MWLSPLLLATFLHTFFILVFTYHSLFPLGSSISNTLVNNDDAVEDAPDLNTKAPHTEGHTSKPVMMTAFETVSIHPIHSTKTDQIRSPSTNPDEWKESNLVISADTDLVIPEQTDPVDSADTSMSTNCSERSDESRSV